MEIPNLFEDYVKSYCILSLYMNKLYRQILELFIFSTTNSDYSDSLWSSLWTTKSSLKYSVGQSNRH